MAVDAFIVVMVIDSCQVDDSRCLTQWWSAVPCVYHNSFLSMLVMGICTLNSPFAAPLQLWTVVFLIAHGDLSWGLGCPCTSISSKLSGCLLCTCVPGLRPALFSSLRSVVSNQKTRGQDQCHKYGDSLYPDWSARKTS